MAHDRTELLEHGTEAGLTARDAAIGVTFQQTHGQPDQSPASNDIDLLRYWLENMRQHNGALPGKRLMLIIAGCAWVVRLLPCCGCPALAVLV